MSVDFMGSVYYEDSDPVAVGYKDDAWYRGASTASGAGIGAGLGSPLGPAGMAIGGALGGWIGGLFEPDAPDVIYEDLGPQPVVVDKGLPELPGTAYLQHLAEFGPNNPQATANYRSLAEKYGVNSPYGFGQS